MLLNVFSIVICVGFVIRGITYIIGIHKSLNYLRQQNTNCRKISKKPPEIIVLLPLLREQRVFHDLCRHFRKLEYQGKLTICFITTEKERLSQTNKKIKHSTIELVRNYCKKAAKNIKHIHYPFTTGGMAHQLNYAVREILSRTTPNQTKDIYIALYNADSKPDKKTFTCVRSMIARKNIPVLQQVSLFTQNYKEYKNNFQGLVLKASAIIQTRWSLGYELPMLLSQSSFWESNKPWRIKLLQKIFEPEAYCVGHGLFIRLDMLKSIGLFPTETNNEDIPLGYYLSHKGIPIYPIPILENSENPDSIQILIKQKSSWFWGMVDYLTYNKYLKLKTGRYDFDRVFISTIKCLLRDAFAWLSCSIGIIALIIFCIINPIIIPLTVFTFFIYFFLPSFILLRTLPSLTKNTSAEFTRQSFCEKTVVSSFTLVYLILSGTGPWISMFYLIKSWLTGSERPKPKTER